MTRNKNSNTKNKSHRKNQSKLSKIISRCNSISKRVGDRQVTASNKIKSKYAIKWLFDEMSPNEIKLNFNLIFANILFKDYVWLSRVREPSESFRPYAKSKNIEQDIIWCSLLINKQRNIISESIRIEKEIQKCILNGEFSNAKSNLDLIQSKIGFSIWFESIKSGIDVIDEVQSNKKALDLLTGDNDLLKYALQRSCGYYQDEDIFLTSIKTDKRIFDRNRESPVSKIISYYAFPQNSLEKPDYKVIFSAVRYTSIYDIYKLLTSYIKHESIDYKNEDGAIPVVTEALRMLPIEIGDPLLLNLAAMHNLANHVVDEEKFIKINLYDLYINEKYEEIVNKINSMKDEFIDFDLFELAVRANIRSNNLQLSKILMQISDCMRDLILKNNKYSESYQSLSFIAYTFRALNWFNQLQIFIEMESEFLTKRDAECLERNYSLHIDGNSTKKISFLGEKYADFIKSKNISTSINLICDIAKQEGLNRINLNSVSLPMSLIKIRELMNQNKPREVLENLYLIIGKNKDPVLTIEAKRLLMDCLLLLNRSKEALSIFVSESISHLYNASIYDIEKIMFECIKDFKKSQSIDYPIALSIFSRLKSSKYDSELKYSFEVFLLKNGYKKPQELLGRIESFEKDRLFYFLKWVCTQENMSLFLGFSSPEEIEECRITICDYLIRKGDSSDYITKELLEINKRKAELLATQNIDRSRIFVDTSTFYGRDSEQYRILFERYLQCCKIDYSEAEDELTIKDIVSALKAKEDIKNYDLASVLSGIHLSDVRLNKKNATFLSLAKLFREEFTFGNKGLNNHLSTRIRHGVLPTALRKPFSDEGLFIAGDKSELAERFKIAVASEELANEYEESLINILKLFTEGLEIHINKINDCWLQIYTQDSAVSLINNLEENNLGQFNFSISAIESYFVQQGLPISPTYDDLVKVMVNWLWGKTNHNLSKIKNLIRFESEPFLIKALEDLRRTITAEIPCHQLRSELSNSISRAKGKVPGQVEMIQSWFAKEGQLNQMEPIGLSTVVEIAGKSLSLKIDLNAAVECKISSRSISYFADMFHILFENAISKSGLSRGRLNIIVHIFSTEEGFVNISVSNDCSEESIKKIDIDFYQEAYGDEELIRDSLQKEGGTGLFKIWKILEKDLDIKHEMKVYIGDNVFCITFSIPVSKDIAIL